MKLEHDGLELRRLDLESSLRIESDPSRIQGLEAQLAALPYLREAFRQVGRDFVEDLEASAYQQISYSSTHQPEVGPHDNPTQWLCTEWSRVLVHYQIGQTTKEIMVNGPNGFDRLIWVGYGLYPSCTIRDWRFSRTRCADPQYKCCIYLYWGEEVWTWLVRRNGVWELFSRKAGLLDRSVWIMPNSRSPQHDAYYEDENNRAAWVDAALERVGEGAIVDYRLRQIEETR